MKDYKENRQTSLELERLTLASKAVGLGIYDWNLESGALYWDDNMKELFGAGNQPIDDYNAYFFGLLVTEDRDRITDNLTEILSGKSELSSFTHEYRIKLRNKTKHIATNGLVFRNEAKEVVRIIGACQDITKQKAAELARNESERMLLDLIENLPGFVYRCQLKQDWEMQYISENIYELSGYKSSELEYNRLLSYSELIVAEDKQMVWDEVNSQLLAGNSFVLQYRITCKDGSIKWVWEKGKAIKDKNDEVKFLEGVVEDISEIMQAREEMLLLLNNTNEFFILLDKNLRIITFNKSFKTNYQHFFGKQIEKGKSILEYAQATRKDELKQLYEKVLQGEIIETELNLVDEQQLSRSFALTYHPAYNVANEIIGVFVTTVEITDTKNLQKRFQALVENSNDGIAIFDQNILPFYVSPSTKKILGYEPHEVQNQDVTHLFHPDDAAIAQANLLSCFDKPGVTIKCDTVRMRHKNGQWRWIEAIITNLLHDPAINGIVDNFRDVTDEIEAQKKLKDNIERFELIANATNDYIWDYNFEENQNWGNNQLYRFYGLNPQKDKITSEIFYDRLHPDDREGVRHLIADSIKKKLVAINAEYRLRDANGSYRQILDQAFVRYNNQGVAVRMIGSMLDITEKTASERKVLDLNRRLTFATSAAQMGVFEWDLHTNTILWDDKMRDLYEAENHDDDTTSLEAWLKYIHESDIKNVLNTLEFYKKGHTQAKTLFKIKTPSGKLKHIEASGLLIKDENDRISKVIGVNQDVTERENQLETIKEQYEKLKKIAWTQAHVVRAPLANIMGMVELLMEELKQINDINTNLLYLKQSTQTLDEILHSMVREAEKIQ
ncbi:PAS domain-containing protein [bacterium]|nr:PAS domain-containing protein [bacterium]